MLFFKDRQLVYCGSSIHRKVKNSHQHYSYKCDCACERGYVYFTKHHNSIVTKNYHKSPKHQKITATQSFLHTLLFKGRNITQCHCPPLLSETWSSPHWWSLLFCVNLTSGPQRLLSRWEAAQVNAWLIFKWISCTAPDVGGLLPQIPQVCSQ